MRNISTLYEGTQDPRFNTCKWIKKNHQACMKFLTFLTTYGKSSVVTYINNLLQVLKTRNFLDERKTGKQFFRKLCKLKRRKVMKPFLRSSSPSSVWQLCRSCFRILNSSMKSVNHSMAWPANQDCGSGSLFSFTADPDPTFYFIADPDPAPHQKDGRICDHWTTDPHGSTLRIHAANVGVHGPSSITSL